MKRAYLPFAALLLVALCACVQQSFNARAQTAYQGIAGLANTTQTLLAADKISADDAQNVVTVGTNLKTGVDIAVQVHATDAQAGSDKLAATIAGLTALQAYLASRSKP